MIGRTLGPPPLSTTNLANFYYTRPSEFLDLAVIPEPGVTEMFTFLVAVLQDPDASKFPGQIMGPPTLSAVNYVAIHCDVTNSGHFTVDWGDGNPAVMKHHSDFSSDVNGYSINSHGSVSRVASHNGESNVLLYQSSGGRDGIKNNNVDVLSGNNYTLTFDYYADASFSGVWGVEYAYANRISIASNFPTIATGAWTSVSLTIPATRPSTSSLEQIWIRPQADANSVYANIATGDQIGFKNIKLVLDNSGLGEVLSEDTNHYHIYNYDDLPASSEFRGYRQVVLSAYPSASNNKFETIQTDIDGPFTPGFTSETTRNGSNLLDIAMSSGNATNFDIGGNSRPHKMCEKVALYNTPSNKLITAQNGIYSGMNTLQEIVNVPYMHVDTTESHQEVFRHCNKLRYLPDDFADPDRYWFWNSSSMYLAFESCFKLEYLPEGLFTGRGTITELANVTDYRYMFRYCYYLCYIPELPVRTSGSPIRVNRMFFDCHYLKRLPKNLRANNVTSASTDGIVQMFYNTLRLSDFVDWDLTDMDSSAKQPQSMDCRGYMYQSGRDVNQIVPWIGVYLDDINNVPDIGSNNIGPWRCRTGPQFFAPEYYARGYINYENVDDAQDLMNGNYCIKEYPILKFSPNALTHTNACFRMMYGNRSLKSVTFSGFAVNETFGNGEYYQMFYQCYMLSKIIGMPFNAANDSGDYSSTFSNAYNIAHFEFPGLSSDETGFSQNVSLRYCPLDLPNIENIFRYLKTGSFTITLTNNNFADAIPAEVEAIATDKGWTVTH